MRKLVVITIASLALFSCSSEEKKKENKVEKPVTSEPNYKELGLSITNSAQSTLLKHVGQSMKMGGPNAAIQYCNINAMSIADSLSSVNKVLISRVAEKNRNNSNLISEYDTPIWEHYKTGEQNVQMSDTVVKVDGKHVYYRPIYIANPACLNCHGQKGTDIMDGTVTKIAELYPNDRATGYNLGDLRGMWKIEFK